MATLAGTAVLGTAAPALAAGRCARRTGRRRHLERIEHRGLRRLARASKVWYTLADGELQNVYYPETDAPDTFGLQYFVTDGSSFTDTETANTSHAISLADPTSLAWNQTNTATSGKYTITKTYIADPSRSVILVQTTFTNLTRTPLHLYADYQP